MVHRTCRLLLQSAAKCYAQNPEGLCNDAALDALDFPIARRFEHPTEDLDDIRRYETQ